MIDKPTFLGETLTSQVSNQLRGERADLETRKNALVTEEYGFKLLKRVLENNEYAQEMLSVPILLPTGLGIKMHNILETLIDEGQSVQTKTLVMGDESPSMNKIYQLNDKGVVFRVSYDDNVRPLEYFVSQSTD